MKVVAIAPIRFSSSTCVTGDATQMRETVKALQNIPDIEVECLFYESPHELTTSDKSRKVKWSELAASYDVAHVFCMFPKGYASVRQHLAKLPTLVSTVYWNNLFREYISVKNGTTPRFILRSFEYIFRRIFNFKKTDYASWCIGILPNSWAEGTVFRNVFKLRRHAICIPVPNAISIPEVDIHNIPRPTCVPETDYIVCPGIFAPRKNQIALIRAMKGSGIPMVFMGKEFDLVPSHYKKCRREADENMYFVGHIPSTTPEYWAILRHARVSVLSSDCETPGIAMIESSLAGARPVITIQGGTQEYFGLVAEYLNPFSQKSIRNAIIEAWGRGRLTSEESKHFERFTWDWTAQLTAQAYSRAIEVFNQHYSAAK